MRLISNPSPATSATIRISLRFSLQHLEKTGAVLAGGALLPEARGPPQGLLDLN